MNSPTLLSLKLVASFSLIVVNYMYNVIYMQMF